MGTPITYPDGADEATKTLIDQLNVESAKTSKTTSIPATAGYNGPTVQVSAAPYPGAITTRALGIVYKNTTGKPMRVKIVSSNSGEATLSAYSDASNPPTTKVDAQSNGATFQTNVSIDVLPNNYYKASWNAGTPNLIVWNETY